MIPYRSSNRYNCGSEASQDTAWTAIVRWANTGVTRLPKFYVQGVRYPILLDTLDIKRQKSERSEFLLVEIQEPIRQPPNRPRVVEHANSGSTIVQSMFHNFIYPDVICSWPGSSCTSYLLEAELMAFHHLLSSIDLYNFLFKGKGQDKKKLLNL